MISHQEDFDATDENPPEKATKYLKEIEYIIPSVLPASESLIQHAESVIGTPWVYAGEDPKKGFDCSGFVIWTYGNFGYKLPHKTTLLASIGDHINIENATSGDLVCFGANSYDPSNVYHIGIIHSVDKDDIKMIHCGTSTGVSIAPLTSGYWSNVKHFIVRIKN